MCYTITNLEIVDFIIYITYNKEGVTMIETNLAQTVNAANDSGSVYDTNVKIFAFGQADIGTYFEVYG